MSSRKEANLYTKNMKAFVSSRLNKKEKIILKEAANNKTNVTRLVYQISKDYGFSKTCIWYNLKKLKQSGLLDFGDLEKKGINVQLTFLGSLIYQNGGENNGKRN